MLLRFIFFLILVFALSGSFFLSMLDLAGSNSFSRAHLLHSTSPSALEMDALLDLDDTSVAALHVSQTSVTIAYSTLHGHASSEVLRYTRSKASLFSAVRDRLADNPDAMKAGLVASPIGSPAADVNLHWTRTHSDMVPGVTVLFGAASSKDAAVGLYESVDDEWSEFAMRLYPLSDPSAAPIEVPMRGSLPFVALSANRQRILYSRELDEYVFRYLQRQEGVWHPSKGPFGDPALAIGQFAGGAVLTAEDADPDVVFKLYERADGGAGRELMTAERLHYSPMLTATSPNGHCIAMVGQGVLFTARDFIAAAGGESGHDVQPVGLSFLDSDALSVSVDDACDHVALVDADNAVLILARNDADWEVEQIAVHPDEDRVPVTTYLERVGSDGLVLYVLYEGGTIATFGLAGDALTESWLSALMGNARLVKLVIIAAGVITLFLLNEIAIRRRLMARQRGRPAVPPVPPVPHPQPQRPQAQAQAQPQPAAGQ